MIVGENVAGGPAAPDRRPSALDAVLVRLGELQACAEAHGPGDGLACVNRLWTDVVRDVCGRLADGAVEDPEFMAALVSALTRRYLRAVGDATTGGTVPRAWRVLLDRRDDPGVGPLQFAMAGASALVHHDLAPALVSTCTVLGRELGEVEQADCDVLVQVIAEHVGRAVSAGRRTVAEDLAGLGSAVTRCGAGVTARLLWTLRGRPAEAEAERVAIDWRASMIGRALLAPGA